MLCFSDSFIQMRIIIKHTPKRRRSTVIICYFNAGFVCCADKKFDHDLDSSNSVAFEWTLFIFTSLKKNRIYI